MKLLQICCFLCFAFSHSYSQDIKITYTDSLYNKGNSTYYSFDFISADFDLSNKTKIASLKGASVNSKTKNLQTLFNAFWKSTIDLGANAFRIDHFTKTAPDAFDVSISVYLFSKEEKITNEGLFPKNKIYIIGNIYKMKEKTFKLNNEKFTIRPFDFIEHQNEMGTETSIGVGGLLGAKVVIRAEEGKTANYFSPVGLDIGPPNSYKDFGVTLNTGSIHPVNIHFGQFLTTLFTKN